MEAQSYKKDRKINKKNVRKMERENVRLTSESKSKCDSLGEKKKIRKQTQTNEKKNKIK